MNANHKDVDQIRQSEGSENIKVKFGTAGVRGLFGQSVWLHETAAVAAAVSKLLSAGTFGLGYDTRKSSSLFATVLASTMNWYGNCVEDYGVVPTPVLAYNIRQRNLSAGFSVTASHNPPEYAGVKVFGSEGLEFSLEQEHELEQLMERGNCQSSRDIQKRFGHTIDVGDAVANYIDELSRLFVPSKKKLKILVDCGGGTSDRVTPFVLSQLGHNVVTINSHESAIFSGRLPEPVPKTLQDVACLTRGLQCDIGIAHDGDADRLVIIDEFGNVVPDYATCLLVLKIVLLREKRGTVVMSYNSSDALETLSHAAGCVVLRSKLGKTFQQLYESKGIFACEPSKMVDPVWGFWEDGIYSALRLVEYLSEQDTKLSQLVRAEPTYYDFACNMQLDSQVRYMVMRDNIESELGTLIDTIEDLDGLKIRVRDPKGWFMLRASGTENKFRVFSESKNRADALKLLEIGTRLLSKSSNT